MDPIHHQHEEPTMPKYRGNRIENCLYSKQTASGKPAWYADFRDYGKFGGRQEALKPCGSSRATSDHEVAVLIATRRLRELRELEAGEVPYSAERGQLGALFPVYLRARASDRNSPTQQWLGDLVRHAERAIEFFGADFEIGKITSEDIGDFEAFLMTYRHSRGVGFSEGSIHQHVGTLSSMCGWALRGRLITGARNRVDDVRRDAAGRLAKPTYERSEFLDWDEILDTLRFIKAMPPKRSDETPHFFEKTALGFYTGARLCEIDMLTVSDDLSSCHGSKSREPSWTLRSSTDANSVEVSVRCRWRGKPSTRAHYSVPAPSSKARAPRDGALKPTVERIWRLYFRIHGAERDWKQMLRDGIPVARCRVEPLMREMRLQGAVRGQTWITTARDDGSECSLDLVDRDFRATRSRLRILGWRVSSPPAGAEGTATTTPWPKASSDFARRRWSGTDGIGGPSKTSSSPPSSGSGGSSTTVSLDRSGTSPRSSLKRTTFVAGRSRTLSRHSTKIAPEKPGAVH